MHAIFSLLWLGAEHNALFENVTHHRGDVSSATDMNAEVKPADKPLALVLAVELLNTGIPVIRPSAVVTVASKLHYPVFSRESLETEAVTLEQVWEKISYSKAK